MQNRKARKKTVKVVQMPTLNATQLFYLREKDTIEILICMEFHIRFQTLYSQKDHKV